MFIFVLILLPVLYSCEEEPCKDLYPSQVRLTIFNSDFKNVTLELTALKGIGMGKEIPRDWNSTAIVELKLNSGISGFQFERNNQWDTLLISSTVTGLYEGTRCGYTQRSSLDSFSFSSGIDSIIQSNDFFSFYEDLHNVKIFLK